MDPGRPTPQLLVLPKGTWEDELAAELERRGIPAHDAQFIARASVRAVLEHVAGRRLPVDVPD